MHAPPIAFFTTSYLNTCSGRLGVSIERLYLRTKLNVEGAGGSHNSMVRGGGCLQERAEANYSKRELNDDPEAAEEGARVVACRLFWDGRRAVRHGLPQKRKAVLKAGRIDFRAEQERGKRKTLQKVHLLIRGSLWWN
jgi:hypothetical protein